MKIGFDNEKYLKMQSEHIRERISHFGGKLYLEFGGKLLDDMHASRVLPGFKEDSKLQMLLQLKDQAEMIMTVSAEDIVNNKIRGDLGIGYDDDVIRLIREYRGKGLYVSSVVIAKYTPAHSVEVFQQKLEKENIKVYHHFFIPGYPTDINTVISPDGYGKNDYVETTRPLIIVTAPGPGSGKMSTCLSQVYNEHQRGVAAGYAKFETFPIWNLPLNHPVNLAYEAATADLNDINMIDPYHLKAYGVTTVNYNRDIEIFPVLRSMFEGIYGSCPYASPTDMGVNMAGNCIIDDDICREAGDQEIIRRYFQAAVGIAEGTKSESELSKIKILMNQEGLNPEDRKVVAAARQIEKETGAVATAMELEDGTIIPGHTGDIMGPSAVCLIKALRFLAGIPEGKKILPSESLIPINRLKTMYLGSKNPLLHPDEMLLALSIASTTEEDAQKTLQQLPKLRGCQVHTTARLSATDRRTFKKLGCDLTYEPKEI
ncbi:MAG: DUF1846 domain-containing protein [Lachnospiraceae bacterium]|nr:DUF1846 domain-containing protein [Lachnospiraceae bacterium]